MSKPAKKVLYLIPHPNFFGQIDGIGGHVAHVHGVIGALRKAGYELSLVVGDGRKDLSDIGYDVQAPEGAPRNRLVFGLAILGLLRRAMKERRYDFVYMRYVAGFAPFIPLVKRIIKPCRLVLEVNSIKSQKLSVYRSIDMIAMNAADIIITISETLRDHLYNRFGLGIGQRCLVLPNGVDIDRFQCSQASLIPRVPRMKYIGYVGVLKPDYGLEDLLNAFRSVCAERSDLQLIIIGGGSILEELRALAADLEQVQFTGIVSFDKVPSTLNALDMVVYTTSEENAYMSPIKIFEYMAARRPVIAAATQQTRSLLDNGRCGLLYEIGNEKSLVDAILRLADDDALAEQLAAAAFAEAEQNHSWSSRIDLLLTRLRQIEGEAH